MPSGGATTACAPHSNPAVVAAANDANSGGDQEMEHTHAVPAGKTACDWPRDMFEESCHRDACSSKLEDAKMEGGRVEASTVLQWEAAVRTSKAAVINNGGGAFDHGTAWVNQSRKRRSAGQGVPSAAGEMVGPFDGVQLRLAGRRRDLSHAERLQVAAVTLEGWGFGLGLQGELDGIDRSHSRESSTSSVATSSSPLAHSPATAPHGGEGCSVGAQGSGLATVAVGVPPSPTPLSSLSSSPEPEPSPSPSPSPEPSLKPSPSAEPSPSPSTEPKRWSALPIVALSGVAEPEPSGTATGPQWRRDPTKGSAAGEELRARLWSGATLVPADGSGLNGRLTVEVTAPVGAKPKQMIRWQSDGFWFCAAIPAKLGPSRKFLVRVEAPGMVQDVPDVPVDHHTKAAAAAKAQAAAAKAEAKVAAKAQAEAKALGPFGCLQCLAKFTSTRWQERHRCGTLPPHPRSAPPRQPTTHIRPRAKPQVVTSSAACSAPPHS